MWGAVIGDLAGSIFEYGQSKKVSSIEVKELITKDSFFTDDTILANLFANEQDTLTLVRFRLTERTNFCTHLTQQLLVARTQDDQGVLVSL